MHLFCDAFDGVVGGEDCAFLPGDEVREVVAGEVCFALGFFKLCVGRGAAGDEVVREAAEGVWDLGPCDIDRFGEQVGAAWVKELNGLTGGFELCFDGGECAEGGELAGGSAAEAANELLLGVEASNQDPSGREEFIGGVPDEVDFVFEEGDATVDVVLFLPEAWRLPGDFIERNHGHACECLLGFGREVVFGFGEDWQRQGADAEVGGDGLGCAGFGVSDGDALAGGGDLGDGTLVVDHVAERVCEAVCDAIHTADGLEHGGLPVDLLFVELAGGHVGGEEFGEVERFVQNGVDRACTGASDEACARSAGVTSIFVEVAEVLKEFEKTGSFFFGELVVEGVFVDRFREEFGEIAACVVDDLSLLDGVAVVELWRLHEG